MRDADPMWNTGKEKRVAGVFVFMLGAGIFLETRTGWLGALVMVCGATAFVWGMIATRARSSVHAPVRATPSPEGHQ